MVEPVDKLAEYVIQICPHDTAPFGDLCQTYAEAARLAGFEPITVFLGEPTADPLPNAIYLNVKDVKAAKQISQMLPSRLPKIHLRQQYAIILCHRYRALKVALWSDMPQEKVICLAHEYGFFARRDRRWLRPLFAKKVHFAGVSNDLAAEIAAVTGFHMVLPNAVRPEEVLSREGARAELALPNDVPIVGVVGRLHYKKRPDKAIAAVDALREKIPNAALVFLGDGDLEFVADQPDWVYTPGSVPAARRYMKAFDALLHVGDVESFGMVILEAIAAGVPAVVGRFPGPEFVLGDLGYFADDDTDAAYANQLDRALSINDGAEWRARAERRVKEKFSLIATRDRMKALADFLHNTSFGGD